MAKKNKQMHHQFCWNQSNYTNIAFKSSKKPPTFLMFQSILSFYIYRCFLFLVWLGIFWIFRIFSESKVVPQEDLRVHVHVAPSTATLKLRWRSTPRWFLPSKGWCLNPKGLLSGTPTPIHLAPRKEGPGMFWILDFFFEVVTDFVFFNSPRIFVCKQFQYNESTHVLLGVHTFFFLEVHADGR